MLNQFIISSLLTFFISLVLSLFVYFRNPTRKLINRVFAFYNLSIASWSFGFFKMITAQNITEGFLWSRLLHIGAIFIPTTFLHFVFTMLDIAKRKQKVILTCYVCSFVILCLSFTNLFAYSPVPRFSLKYFVNPGPIYHIFTLFFFSVVVFNHIELLKEYKVSSSLRKNMIKYLLLAHWIGYSGGATAFLPLFNIPMPIFGLYLVPICMLISAYIIVIYRLMDIRLVITRAGIFAFVYTLVLGIPFGIGGLVREPFSKIAPTWWWLLPMFLLVVLASAGPFIYIKLQRRIEYRLRAEEFKYHKALRRLSHNMLRFTNLEGLLKLIVHYLIKILKLKFAAIYLLDGKTNKYILKSYWRPQRSLQTTFQPPVEFSKDSSLIKDIYLRRIPIVTEELKLFAPEGFSPHIKGLLTTLSNLKANTVIPSFLRNDLLGFLVLSDRRTNLAFTQQDLNLLMVLANEAGLAIENAQFHQKEKLILVEKSRREALADMAPGASHQFNNRLVSISSSAELLLLKLENIKMDKVKDEDTKNILKDAKITLELIDQEVYKGKQITSAILRRAKAKVDFQKVNVQGLIENAYRLVLISHSGSGLDKFKEPRFKLDLLNKIPDIFASEALLQDCFYNLIDNAFDAIGDAAKENPPVYQGEVEAALKHENNSIVIQIKDNGIGLTKENQRKLFTPYFTTKASSNKGSGLGLYIIRDFIERHSGTIRCDSEYGKGTIFTVRLPIEKRNARRK